MLSEVTSKGQDEIPPNLLGKDPIAIGEIRNYLWDPGELTLSFFMDGAREGKRISFLVHFSRSAKVESRATLRVKERGKFTDYKLDLGSKFTKGLAQQISLKLPGESHANLPYSKSHGLKHRGPSRIKALRQLLEGTYSRENEPK